MSLESVLSSADAADPNKSLMIAETIVRTRQRRSTRALDARRCLREKWNIDIMIFLDVSNTSGYFLEERQLPDVIPNAFSSAGAGRGDDNTSLSTRAGGEDNSSSSEEEQL